MEYFRTKFLGFGLAVMLITVFSLKTQAQSYPPGPPYKDIVLNPAFEHTKWGIEPADKLYHFDAYTTSFDTDDDNDGDGDPDIWGIPEWVAFEIKKHDAAQSIKRPTWMTDAALHKAGIAPNDDTYHVEGTRSLKEVKDNYRYIRGHMCPKDVADRISANAGYNTHTVLNAVPQLQWQNNGIWKVLEQKCVEWAVKHERVWVVCGPVFFNKNPSVWLGQEDEVKAAVPDAIYKIVIRESNTETGVETIAFLFPNVLPTENKDNIQDFVTHIGRLEDLTGLKFLTTLTEAQRKVELNVNGKVGDW